MMKVIPVLDFDMMKVIPVFFPTSNSSDGTLMIKTVEENTVAKNYLVFDFDMMKVIPETCCVH